MNLKFNFRNSQRNWWLLVLVFFCTSTVSAQFYGGDGDGYDSGKYNGLLNGRYMDILYQGGEGNGFTSIRKSGKVTGISTSEIYSGGNGDGYSSEKYYGNLGGISTIVLFAGGHGQAFDHFRLSGKFRGLVLPVSLVSFEAYPEENFVLLKWVTEAELNNDFFTLERSQDAQLFEALLNIPGAGTTSISQMYKHTDSKPLNGTSYYRLKSTDFDGTFSYSQIEAVQFSKNAPWDLILSPNPNKGKKINIKLEGLKPNSSILISILDIQGTVIYQNNFEHTTNQLSEEINLKEGLSKGTYLVRATSGSNYINKLIIIQ